MPGIFTYFINFAQKELNTIPVKVIVNTNPSDDVQNKVKSFVHTNIGTNTPINYEVSSSVLGGIILKYKDNEIDLSIDNKINGLQTALIN